MLVGLTGVVVGGEGNCSWAKRERVGLRRPVVEGVVADDDGVAGGVMPVVLTVRAGFARAAVASVLRNAGCVSWGS